MEKKEVCCVCGTECPPGRMKQIEVKGKVRKICAECVTHIHGLI